MLKADYDAKSDYYEANVFVSFNRLAAGDRLEDYVQAEAEFWRDTMGGYATSSSRVKFRGREWILFSVPEAKNYYYYTVVRDDVVEVSLASSDSLNNDALNIRRKVLDDIVERIAIRE